LKLGGKGKKGINENKVRRGNAEGEE